LSGVEASAPRRLRVCIDADALFAGAASATGASHLILQLGELGVIELGVPEQAVIEAERNLRAKLPAALPAFRTMVDACTTRLPMSSRRAAALLARSGDADPKDAPILAAAIAGECRWLVTFNVRDYRTERVRVSEPGPFVESLRAQLAGA